MADIFLRTSIGDVMLDAELGESHTSDLRVTDNPVESGAEVSDHSVVMPKAVTIEGVVVEYEPTIGTIAGLGSMIPRTAADFLNLLPMAISFATNTAQTQAYASRVLSSYSGPGASLVSGTTRALAPWLPDLSDVASVLTGASPRIKRIYESLLRLQKNGKTIDIQTGLRLYKSMLITMVSGMMTKRGSLQISIAARELFVVETQTISGVQVPLAGTNKSGRAGAQSAAKSSKGNTSPGDVATDKNSSVLNTIGGLFK